MTKDKTKVCSICERELPLTREFFHYRARDKSGFRNTCITCRSYETHKTLTSIFRKRLRDARLRARSKAVPFSLSLEDLKKLWKEQKGRCYYSGVRLFKEHRGPNSISIDRVNPSKGYVRDNIKFCLWKVNRMKHDMVLSDFINTSKLVYLQSLKEKKSK